MADLRRLRARARPLVPLLRALGFVVAVGLVVLVGVRAVADVPLGDLDPALLALATAAALVWWLGLGHLWSLLASGAWDRRAVGVWCRTQPLRYLPGGVWAPASRLAVLGGSATDRLWIVGGENVVAVCAALVVGGVALAASGAPAWLALAVLGLLPVAVAHAFPARLAPRRARRATASTVVAFAAYALAAVLAQGAVSGLHHPLAVAGAGAVAWAAGLVVVIAPSGLGVREVVYVALLADRLPHGELAAAALVLRLVTVAAELLVLVAAGRPRRRPAAAAPESSV
jgi:hypothetical protein